ncbi:hypothetical protein ON010_g591 [Phytophthora cinnamomi]|nr:hypothetical protein ON010_g591 [Phytophthora cinnamomi]
MELRSRAAQGNFPSTQDNDLRVKTGAMQGQPGQFGFTHPPIRESRAGERSREKRAVMVAVRGKFVGTDNVPFGRAWRELKKHDWTSVRPRAKDLDPKWKYDRPGADPNVVKGVDFFHGEEEQLDVPCPPPDSFADEHGAPRTPAASNSTSEPAQPPPVATTATLAQAEAVGQAPATTPPAKTATPVASRRTPTTKAATPRNTPAGDSEEDKAPPPALLPSAHAADNVRESVVLPGPHGGEDAPDSAGENASAVETAEGDDVKAFLDEFGGVDAVLAGNLMEKPLKEFPATGLGVIHQPNVYNDLQAPTATRGAASRRLAYSSAL